MDDNDYKQLVEFMERTFTKFDNRLESMEKRLENTATKDDLIATKLDLQQGLEDVKRHTEILIEDVKHGIQAIVDGQRMHDEKQDRDNVESDNRFSRLDKFDMHLMSDIDDHEMRIKALERKS